ncbi:GAF domain-containing protein [Cohnella rhizosphaerae]|uniref:GAF domain-containing protein n=1 Tax=Cohnella rhizosphaerae TaxID=1457232 RepID=A0A9X4KXF2_9BACL|nr:GAF domain-containing protein [Cohnella rhizosphaerae]MDG0812303.1 GAF domain-containing protein [Cohnella rhizosphaerae]
MPSWITGQDLTEADLPYIHPLLELSFGDWVEQSEGFPWLSGWPIELLHPDYTVVAVAGATAIDGLPVSWRRESAGPTAAGMALESCRPALMRADEHEHPALRSRDTMAVPIFSRSSGFVCAAIACSAPAGAAGAGELKLLQAAALHFKSCLYRRFEHLFVEDQLHAASQASREDRRKDRLLEIMRRMNDHIDVENVLAEVFSSLEQMYPTCRTNLFLSQDYSSINERVQPLAFHHQDMDLCWRAFMDGERREDGTGDFRRIAFPLAGKQGVYGVLRLDLAGEPFDDLDLRFVSTLTSGAGTAFEKARMHEQANVLIGELRLINELTQRLNSSLRLSDTIQFATSELLTIFNADFCFILQLDMQLNHFNVISSNVPELNNDVFTIDYGFCGVMLATKEPIILSDYHSATPVRSRLLESTRSRSLIASPLLLNGEVIGAIMVTHRQPNHFSYENYKLLQVLSAHIGLAVSNSSLHAEVRRMVITDNLTGLYARHYLNERIQRKQEKDASGSLIVVDIDHFKKNQRHLRSSGGRRHSDPSELHHSQRDPGERYRGALGRRGARHLLAAAEPRSDAQGGGAYPQPRRGRDRAQGYGVVRRVRVVDGRRTDQRRIAVLPRGHGIVRSQAPRPQLRDGRLNAKLGPGQGRETSACPFCAAAFLIKTSAVVQC